MIYNIRIPVHNAYIGTIGEDLSLLLDEIKEPLLWCGHNGINVDNMAIETKRSLMNSWPSAPVAIVYTFITEEDATAFKLRWI